MTLSDRLFTGCQKKKNFLKNIASNLNIRLVFLLFTLLSCCLQVKASRFEVDNYEGKIGAFPVHVSVQNFSYIRKEKLIDGVYYYDTYRAPIPLHGTFQGEEIILCELRENDYKEPIKIKNIDDCEFRLKYYKDKLIGRWKSKTASYPVELARTNSFYDNYIEKGKIEIPFWGQTREHNFLGVYETDKEEIVINKINVVSKKSGKVIQEINPQLYGCDFGFYISHIYLHVVAENDSTIELNCDGAEYVGNTRFYQYNGKKGKYVYIKDYLDKHYK